jgi:hypothetical protein
MIRPERRGRQRAITDDEENGKKQIWRQHIHTRAAMKGASHKEEQLTTLRTTEEQWPREHPTKD